MFASKTVNAAFKSWCSTITRRGSKGKLHPCTESQPEMKISFQASISSVLALCTKVDFIQHADFVNNPLPFTNTEFSNVSFHIHNGALSNPTPWQSVGIYTPRSICWGLSGHFSAAPKPPQDLLLPWALNISSCTGQIISNHFLHSPSLSSNTDGSSRGQIYLSPQQLPVCVHICKHYQQWFYVL